ncbi:efflux RND transporter permease subunit [Cyanobacterium sp. IPPAS B-1200]|uniref:efflux RND transporter permease subunit n=1 Tax=Cyanobacterium sp. IPPAS B-1200 TaxID=1562720 RepID=UPI0008525FFF|nr:efflux RND transporter permease subunit [Cyanobacterium sp. IPPAS B-1200]OEJ78936.1 RND transporter [Cyanobacterium sp. IPPAS B-1200]
MFVDFFIRRPVFSSVCALIILLVGTVSIVTLPIARFPDIAPTQIQITANYTGADAEVVENTVTNILERQINGVEGLRYISSSSTNSGTSSITATFDASRNKDLAAVDIQNQISVVEGQLPDVVQRTGVTVTQQSNNILMGFGMFSEDGQYDNDFLSNYAERFLVDALKRIEGVADVTVFGERRYAMRLWVDPNRLSSRGLTPMDVENALREQNVQVGVGAVGAEPAIEGQEFQISLRAVSQLTEPEEFEDIILRSDEQTGSLIRFRDVGRVELGAQNYDSFVRFRGVEAVGVGIYQLPGSNALEVAQNVKTQMAELAEQFPDGINIQLAFDTTGFIEESLDEVIITLFMSVALVVLIILVFLQDWRTTLIPSLTIPLSLVGTFAFVRAFDFSINTLTLFGLTLATGLVVDDAIVVVEQIYRYIQDRNMESHRAASESMKQLTGAVIATSLVLMAVFIPVTFFPGTTGALYREFALTIAFSIVISTFLALTLTPSLCALLLKSGQHPPDWIQPFFNRFNSILDWLTLKYEGFLTFLARFKLFVVGIFVVLIALTGWLYTVVPTAFVPEEDQGYFITIIQAPEGVSLQYTSDVMRQVEEEILEIPDVLGTFAIGGFSFGGSTPNQGIIFTPLKPWGDRPNASQSVQGIIGQLFPKFAMIPEARIIPINPPAIQGLGAFGGFTFNLQDRRINPDLQSMVEVMGQFLGAANQDEALSAVFTQFAANSPQLIVEVNRERAKVLDVNLDDVFSTMATMMGGSYVNDFTMQQRSYRVYVQGDKEFRANPESMDNFFVRSGGGEMIPLSNLVTITPTVGAQTINHYNLFRSIEINGSPAPGYSSGNAIEAVGAIASQVLPVGFGYEWTGISLEEISAGNLAIIIFSLGIVLVFLVLSAQYENYVDPFIIILAVPLAILGALLAQSLRGFSNDIYCQIGLVMLIGLASKNSILIVEFANQLRDEGMSTVKAAIEASKQRLRPILMTAISTLTGIFPLVIASGAGAGSRQSLGTAVFGGMLVATFLSLFVVPILYIVIKMAVEKVLPRKQPKQLVADN